MSLSIYELIDAISEHRNSNKAKVKTLFDTSPKEDNISEEFQQDYSVDNGLEDFCKKLKEYARTVKYLLISYDIEATGLLIGGLNPPKVILVSFAFYELNGAKTKLFYKFDKINFYDFYVTSSIKDVEILLKNIFEIKNILIIGWNISGYDHLVLEKYVDKKVIDNFKVCLKANKLYDGILLAQLLMMGLYGKIDYGKTSLKNQAKMLLGVDIDKDIRGEFAKIKLENIKEAHIKYSCLDSIYAGYIFFQLVEKSQPLQKIVLKELIKLETISMAKACGFLTHTIQYLSNYTLTKINNKGIEVDFKQIKVLAKDLELKVGNLFGILKDQQVVICETKEGKTEIYNVKYYKKHIELQKKENFKLTVEISLEFPGMFITDFEKRKLSVKEFEKYVAKEYWGINIVSIKEKNFAKKKGFDIFNEENQAISKEEIKKLEDSPNLQEDTYIKRMGLNSIEQIIEKDLALYCYFMIQKYKKQLAFIKSYLPHYAFLSKKQKITIGKTIHPSVIEKVNSFSVEDLFKVWDIDLKENCTGRLFCNFTVLKISGRTSCTKPNIQQVERSSEIRNIFIAKKGYILIIADYSAIEMGTMAQIFYKRYGFSKLRELINAGTDIHLYTGMTFKFPKKSKAIKKILLDPDILNIALKKENSESFNNIEKKYKIKIKARSLGGDSAKNIWVSVFAKGFNVSKSIIKSIRQSAKPFNFGIAGGMKPATIQERSLLDYGVKISLKEAEEAYESWLKNIPEGRNWINESEDYKKTLNKGIIKEKIIEGCMTLTGRYRHVVDDSFSADNLWHNTQFQGLAADGAKLALYKINEVYSVVNFVHDEIVTEVKIEEQEKAGEFVRNTMIDCMKIFIPDGRVDISLNFSDRWEK